MSNTGETTSGRKRVGPEDKACEDQKDDDGLGPADEDEDEPVCLVRTLTASKIQTT